MHEWMQHLGYFQQFMRRLNHYRYDHNSRPVWLDLEVLSPFNENPRSYAANARKNQHAEKLAVFEHPCSEGFESNPIFLSNDFTHVAIATAEENSHYFLHLLLSKRPLAVDSIARRFCTDVSIVILDNSLTLWGVKTFKDDSCTAEIYGPEKINRCGAGDFTVSLRACTSFQIICVPPADVQYGKTKYSNQLPLNHFAAYECPVVELESTLNELVRYRNQKSKPFANEKHRFLPATILSTKTGSLFENTCPNKGSNFSHEPKTIQSAGSLMSSSKRIGNVQSTNSKPHQRLQKHPFLARSHDSSQSQLQLNTQPPKMNLSESKHAFSSSLKKQLSEGWDFKKQQKQARQPSKVYEVKNVAIAYQKEMHNSPADDAFERLTRIIHESTSNTICDRTSFDEAPQLVIVSSGVRYPVNRYLMIQHSCLIRDALLPARLDQTQIVIEDANPRLLEVFFTAVSNPRACSELFTDLSLEDAVELAGLLQYFGVASDERGSASPFLLEQLMVFVLLPRLHVRSFATVLSLVEAQPSSSQFWPLCKLILKEFFRAHSKQLLGEQDVQCAFLDICEQWAVDLIQEGLSFLRDADHMLDLLGILTTVGYGSNVIEVLERVSRPHQQSRSFLQRCYELPDLKGPAAFLVENHQYGSFNSSNSSQLQAAKADEQTKQPAYAISLSRVKPSGGKWLVVGEQFEHSGRFWRVFVQFEEGSLRMFLRDVGSSKRNLFTTFFKSVEIVFQCRINAVSAACTLFYSFCDGQQDTVGCHLMQHLQPGELISLDASVVLKTSEIHSCCMHHLAIRWKDIMKYSTLEPENNEIRRLSLDMGKRRSCVLLQQKLFESTSQLVQQHEFGAHSEEHFASDLNSQLYRISEENLFALFSSDWLDVSDESLLLMYLSVYLLAHQNRSQLPIAALRLHLIPLRKLLQLSLHHPVLKHSELFMGMLQTQIELRIRNEAGVGKKNRKSSRPLSQQQLTEELMQWLKSDKTEGSCRRRCPVPAKPDPSATSSKNECSVF